MPKITIDGQSIECRENISVLQAALDAGLDVPHYCYHPGLSIVASCRLCLMEMKMPHPKTKELDWSPRLVPSCQTPVRDGQEVRFDSPAVKSNQRHVMEYYLLNHPLDCPVCDQAGECYLQDYSFKFGNSSSRMVDAKHKNAKKDIGPRTLLYQDRCVMCSRCVRFTKEISGTSELCVVNRGSRAEIDVFPGLPLDNKLQGNVVDICPVGCLLDKGFLFAQRVWFLRTTDSICPGCSTGCAIHVDRNEGRVYRLKPRYNPGVNDWWMCDEGRFGWKYVMDERRITEPIVRRGPTGTTPKWEEIPELIRARFAQAVERHGEEKVAAQLSPMMSCEEAWLLAGFIREIAPGAALALGDVHEQGEDECFPKGSTSDNAKFTIRAEKHPNRRGVEAVLTAAGGTVLPREELWERAGKGDFQAVWIVGGYPQLDWPSKEMVKALGKTELLVVQDMFPNKLTSAATIVLPACPWTECEGSFMNHAGLVQPFDRAVPPAEGARQDGQYLFEIAGHSGLYTGERVREMMAEKNAAFAEISETPPVPTHQH